MLRVLVLSRNFPPVLGGMERLNQHLVEELSKHHAVHLVAPEGADRFIPGSVATSHVKLRPLWCCLSGIFVRGIKVAKSWHPQLILGGSGLVAPIVWIIARLCKARAVIYVHGLDITVPHPVYKYLWLPFFRRMDLVIANSRATKALAINVGVQDSRISVLNPGVDEKVLSGTNIGFSFRKKHHLETKKILLSVGRLAARKGLKEFVRDAFPSIVSVYPDAVLVIIGSVPKNALYAEAQSPEMILAEAEKKGLKKSVFFLGQLSNEELLEAYASADLHVFPVIHIPDNPEGFGMVAIEAAMQGVATVAYATGGVIDAVEHNCSGRLAAPGNTDAFIQSVLDLLENPLDREAIHQFSRNFTWKKFGEKLVKILDEK